MTTGRINQVSIAMLSEAKLSTEVDRYTLRSIFIKRSLTSVNSCNSQLQALIGPRATTKLQQCTPQKKSCHRHILRCASDFHLESSNMRCESAPRVLIQTSNLLRQLEADFFQPRSDHKSGPALIREPAPKLTT